MGHYYQYIYYHNYTFIYYKILYKQQCYIAKFNDVYTFFRLLLKENGKHRSFNMGLKVRAEHCGPKSHHRIAQKQKQRSTITSIDNND